MTPPESAVMAAPPTDLDQARIDRFRRRMVNSWLTRVFMLAKMPLGFFAGLRVRELNTERCETTVPYGWRSTNPFRSIYFAAQSMAAELSTGALAMLAIEASQQPVAMLITGLESEFIKKANQKTTFTCEGGAQVFNAVQQAIAGEPTAVRVETVGRMPDGTEVSRFYFTWSFKLRAPRA